LSRTFLSEKKKTTHRAGREHRGENKNDLRIRNHREHRERKKIKRAIRESPLRLVERDYLRHFVGTPSPAESYAPGYETQGDRFC